ncbi:MAG: glycerol-3-phosphate acyltransferase [Candidatus Aminicenantes bacterium]|nr:glycerol-3-phosphate acyltransferase [Candidatus Aminicenantes bacterium]
MAEDVSFPLWLIIIGGMFAAWAVLDHFILPAWRWFFKRRTKIVIKEIDEQLDLRIPAFKLTKRQVLVDRLKYDPEVMKAVEEYSREQSVPNEIALKKVERYAKEIVPAFNAYIYFRIGNWISKSVARMLYRVRMGFADEDGLAKIDPHSSVVFIMNHRSNMDYILLGYLALNRVALSFAVGEWARIWPVQQMIRAMGAFFVRRGSGNPLYRRVLARYVQMATEGGVVQAVYPEGRLSRNGRFNEPRIGLLDYMLRKFDPDGERDLVFIPVAINYDRVLEDRTLLSDTTPETKKKSRLFVVKTTFTFLLHNLWLMVRGHWYRFGYAVANFGSPISTREYLKIHEVDFRNLDKEARIEKVQRLANELMQKVSEVIPVVPVSLIAHVFTEEPSKNFSDLEIKARVQSLLDRLEKQGAHVYIPRSDRDYTINVGLRMLTLRHLVVEENNLYRAAPDEMKLLGYYANSIIHLLQAAKADKKADS